MYVGDLISLPPGAQAHPLIDDLADDIHRKCNSDIRTGLLLVTDVHLTAALTARSTLKYQDVIRLRLAHEEFASLAGLHMQPMLQERLALQLTNAKHPISLLKSKDAAKHVWAGKNAPMNMVNDASGVWSGRAHGCNVDVHWFLVERASPQT
ncbi:MAG TPA: hypothetical protein VGE36_18125 [Roseateles sp.]